MSEPTWSPCRLQCGATTLGAYALYLRDAGLIDSDGENYQAPWQWSVAGPARFWETVWKFCDVRYSQPHPQVLATPAACPEPAGSSERDSTCVRIGTAETYRVVDAQPEVLESVVMGQRVDNDDRVILFVRLREAVEWSQELEARNARAIRTRLTPRHVPARILACPEVPRTISGKITGIAVRELIHGRPVRNADALANPQSLDYFKNLSPEALR